MSKSNQGTWLESQIGRICEAYKMQGVLELEKVEPPLRVVGKRPNVRVIFLKNPFLDYVGTWTRHNGRAIFLEAKSTQEPRLPIATDGGLSLTQFEALERWNNAGAAVGVLWGHADQLRFVPLAAIRSQLMQNTKHVKWSNATPIEPGLGFVFWDFAKVLERYYPAKRELTPQR